MSISNGDISKISASFNGPHDVDESTYVLFETIGPDCGRLYSLSEVVESNTIKANVLARVVLAFDLSEGGVGNTLDNVRGYLATRQTKYDKKPADPSDVTTELERLNGVDAIKQQLAQATVSRSNLQTLRAEWIRRGMGVVSTSQHDDLPAAADKVRLRIALVPFFKSQISSPGPDNSEAPTMAEDAAEQGERNGRGPRNGCKGQSCPGVWKLS